MYPTKKCQFLVVDTKCLMSKSPKSCSLRVKEENIISRQNKGVVRMKNMCDTNNLLSLLNWALLSLNFLNKMH